MNVKRLFYFGLSILIMGTAIGLFIIHLVESAKKADKNRKTSCCCKCNCD